MKKLSCLLLLCVICLGSKAQTAASYLFERTTATYTSISSTGTLFSSINCDDCTSGGIPIGFSFVFCGTTYTSLSASSNMWISLSGNTSCCQYPAYATNIVGAGFLFPSWNDNNGGYGGSSCYYQTTGAAGSKIFTIEYQNWDRYGNSGADMNVQVKLYEGTNVVEFRYGSNTYGTADIGIGISNSTGDYQNLPNSTSTTCVSSLPCCSGTCGLPANGTVLRWFLCSPPPAITGANIVCVGGTTTFANTTAGGTWSTANGAIASVVGGLVTGNSAGVTNITYSTGPGSCYAVRSITVNAAPSLGSVTNNSPQCEGTTLTFNANTPSNVAGYAWTGPVALTGDVTAAASVPSAGAGAAGVYSVTVNNGSGSNCTRTYTTAATQLAAPAAITGTASVCNTFSTSLSTTSTGGTWSSSIPSVASVNSSGLVTGGSTGLTVVSYTMSSGCSTTRSFSVNPLPVVTVTPPGPTTICIGETTSFAASSPNPTFALLSQNFNSGLAGWVVTGTAAPANKWQIATPPGGTADGTPGNGTNLLQAAAQGTLTNSIVTSTSFNTMGYGSATLTFNQYLLSVGDNSILVQYSTNGGSTWTTLANQTNTIVGSPSWSAASPNFSMALPAGALGQSDVRLRWVYDGNAYYWFLDDIAVNGALPASTYSWTGALGLSCTTCTNPTITPTSTGANNYSVTVTSSAGCTTTNGVTVSVNPLPGPITGNLNVCVGTTFTLGNSASGGTWASSNGNVTIGSTTGAMAGVAVGTSTITYALPTGCKVTTVATVAATPSAITGNTAVCEGLTTTLSHAVSGGTWFSTNITVAPISSFGVVSGSLAGTTMITYTLPSGCVVWRTETVNPAPAPITGIPVVCENATTTLSCATPSGAWTSGLPTVATIGGTGVVTGVSAGFSVISYTLGTGCRSTQTVTVNALPAAIGGATNTCQGTTAVVTDATSGGTWSSTNSLVGIIDASGTITASGNSGITIISYILTSTGCGISAPFTVNALPATITGMMEVCSGDMTGLTSSPPGGTWTSSNTATLPIDPSSGVATGGNAGVATVTYTLPVTGCKRTASVTVNELPVPISGTAVVCDGQTTTLYDFTPGGGWSSGNSGIASISPTGVVTGEDAGMAQITYMLSATGCMQTKIVTVNAVPDAITGSLQVCSGSSHSLGNPTGGGTWSSSNSTVASVHVTSGLLTGGTAGNATITYTLATGCYITAFVTTNPLPGSHNGPSAVCAGQTITWSNSTPGITWSSDNTGVASIDAMGVITGVTMGSAVITGTTPLGCERTRTVVVNETPAVPFGSNQVCVGQTATLSSSPSGGVWSSGSSVIAPVSNAGVVTGATAGTTNITYTLPVGGCRSSVAFTVNALPDPITGPGAVCEGSSITLTSATATNWSSSNALIATVDASGVVTGITAGSVTIVCYTASGCERARTIMVNPNPAPIFGNLNVCVGSTTALSDVTPGGTWNSSLPGIASINSSGVVIGNNAGISDITYTLPTTCKSIASVVVHALPANISGGTTICAGQSTTLTSAPSGGNWMSGNSGVASIDGGGVATGNMAGTALMTYAMPTGCQKTIMVQVNPLPAGIVGNMNICQGSTTLLGSATPGGTWASSDMGVASIGLTSGGVIGSNVGFSIITYTLPTGCKTTASIIVNGLPEAITGSPVVCAGSTTQLDNATVGGTWSASSSVATVNAAGLVTGVAAGTTTITYMTGNNCKRTATVLVNALPNLIAGTGNVCEGQAMVFSNANPGGAWTGNDDMIATVDGSTGVVSGVASGTALITYTLPTSCMRSRMVTVHPSVEAIVGSSSVCKGDMTTLTNGTTGGMWMSGNTTVASVGAMTGELTGVNVGAAIVTYALPTGCMSTMTIAVNGLPAAISGASSVCEGSVGTLGNISAGGTWSSSDDGIATISAAGAVTGVAMGSAMMTYTLPTGCMKTKDMVVNPLPMAQTVMGGGSYCAGGTGIAIELDGSEPGVTYELQLSSISVATRTGTGLLLDFGLKTLAGMYTAKATTAEGCMLNMTGSASISVNPLTTPSVTMSSGAGDTVCAATSVTYTATGSNGGLTPSYTWSVGTATVGTGSTYSYVPVNGDQVKVAFTSSAVCPSVASVAASRIMTVIPKLAPSVNITVGPDDTVCQGSMAAFAATSTNGGTAPTYTWLVGGSIVAGVNGPTYSYMPSNNQTVVCKVNSNYRCPSSNNVSSNTITMHVDPQYVPVVSIIAQPGTVVQQGQMVSFTTVVTGGGPAPRYQWLIRGAAVTGATLPTFSSNDLNDGDSVTCVVYGSGACGMATINSVVMKVTEATGVATTALSNSEIRLMPNPTNGTFTVSGTLGSKVDEKVSLEVTDMLGQVVYRGSTMVRGGELNEKVQLGNTLANGMYMLNISSANDRKVFHFVLKQ